MQWRPFTSAGLSPDMTLAELEDQLGRLLKGRTSVHPLDVYREVTGLAHMDRWSEVAVATLMEMVGLEEQGDGLFSPILPERLTERSSAKRH